MCRPSKPVPPSCREIHESWDDMIRLKNENYDMEICMNLFTVLFVVLLVLKLVGLVALSWWVVCAPLVVGFALVAIGISTGVISENR